MSWRPTLSFCVAAFCWGLAAASTTEAPHTYGSVLVGDQACLDGPDYWCKNFTTARQCNANEHCIRTVWEHQTLPEDNGEICDVCKKMVQQARDTLQSNETQENLKLVLEGSCFILIPIKPLARECVKMVDSAIPELIEAIASQMSPQIVCSTAGLCNSARMDALVAAYKTQAKSSPTELNCSRCEAVAGMAEQNFRAASRDHVLNMMLEVCGGLGSFSDSCSALVIVHFNKVYESLAANLYPAGVCHLAGVCQERYHNHAKEVEVRVVPKLEGDMPCELCEQLVQHLRDILVANTTEKEFEQVLLGICGQTKGFKKECVDMVEEYYPVVYAFLTEELDGKVVCTQIGICPRTSTIHPLYPLLPVKVADSLQKESSNLHRIPVINSGVSVHAGSHPLQVSEAQLPLDSLTVIPRDKDLCQICEYFLHFLQNELTDPVNEEALIKKAVKACDGLPEQFAPTCRTFVDTYAMAVVAILAQDIDPSQVCPKIGVCPGLTNSQVQCHPCQSSTSLLLAKVAHNNTEANIKKEMMTLCLSLPFEESQQCSQILMHHTEDLTDMVVADFTSDEMCFYMKYCRAESSPLAVIGGDIDTNEIPQSVAKVGDDQICVLCEFVMKTLEKEIQDKKTEEEIREVVEHICVIMPKTVRPKCKEFIDQYANLIVTLLAQSIDPKQICMMIGACPTSELDAVSIQKSISKCVICESLMGALLGVIEDDDVDRKMNQQLELACTHLPRAMKRECQDMVHQLAPQIEAILEELPVGPLVCRRLQLCGASQSVDLVTSNRCHEGQVYWCLTTMHAATCQKIDHCQKNVWFADKPNKKSHVRAKKFLF